MRQPISPRPRARVFFVTYDVRAPLNDPFPPKTYISYLNDPAIQARIGANHSYTECSQSIFAEFGTVTGDLVRSTLPTLTGLVHSGIQTLLWAGDADWICNWYSCMDSMNAIEWAGSNAFRVLPITNCTVHGVVKGTFKTLENLSWLRVFEAGHLVQAYCKFSIRKGGKNYANHYVEPEVALQVFIQTMRKQAIFYT